MTYRLGSFDDVFYVSWHDAPNATSLASIAPELEAAARRCGRPVSYLTIVTVDVRMPNAEERRAVDEFARRVRPLVDHAYFVLEGDGFRASIHRSVLIGLALWKERGLMTIYRTVDEALHDIAARGRTDYAALAVHARAQGQLR
jgi:hypothetical protein